MQYWAVSMIHVNGIGCENQQLVSPTISVVTVQHHKSKYFLQETTMEWQMLSMCNSLSAECVLKMYACGSVCEVQVKCEDMCQIYLAVYANASKCMQMSSNACKWLQMWQVTSLYAANKCYKYAKCVGKYLNSKYIEIIKIIQMHDILR